MTPAIAVVAGLLIGLSLGALGGGGSILAVPVLVYALGQTPAQATTGSLVVVGVTSLLGAATALATGKALLGRGIAFGMVAIGGAAAGAAASATVPEPVLLATFAVLLLVVATVMITRWVRVRRSKEGTAAPGRQAADWIDGPIISFRPTFRCRCSKAVAVLVSASVVGLLTGFLGVGGGFLVVPALVLVGLPMAYAAGTSLVVITITSASALLVKAGAGASPDWAVVGLLTAAAVAGSWAGVAAAGRMKTGTLQASFSVLLVLVAGYTAWQTVPPLL